MFQKLFWQVSSEFPKRVRRPKDIEPSLCLEDSAAEQVAKLQSLVLRTCVAQIVQHMERGAGTIKQNHANGRMDEVHQTLSGEGWKPSLDLVEQTVLKTGERQGPQSTDFIVALAKHIDAAAGN